MLKLEVVTLSFILSMSLDICGLCGYKVCHSETVKYFD